MSFTPPHLLMLKRISLNLVVILLGLFFILGSGGTPVITILGDNPVTVQQGSVYVDAGATAKDDDGPRQVTTTGLPIDTSKIGTYKVVYSVYSGEGQLITAERIVNVVPVVVTDTTAPVITILGDNPASVEQGETYTDAGATAVDDVDGNVTVTSSGTVDTSTAGSYTITYTASDSAGNVATAIRKVNVVGNNNKTSVSINTGNVNLVLNNTYKIVTVDEEIPIPKNGTILVEVDKEKSEVFILANKYDEPILIGRKFKGEDTVELSLASTAEMFLLRTLPFFGVQVSDERELSKRINAHPDFPKLIIKMKESIESGSSCPTSHECNLSASLLASKIASELNFTDLVEK